MSDWVPQPFPFDDPSNPDPSIREDIGLGVPEGQESGYFINQIMKQTRDAYSERFLREWRVIQSRLDRVVSPFVAADLIAADLTADVEAYLRRYQT